MHARDGLFRDCELYYRKSDLSHLPDFDLATFGTAFVVLVIPQVPLSFANSCLATADAARMASRRLTGRLPGNGSGVFGMAAES